MISFEYFPNRRMCRLSGDNFDEIREHFSVKNEAAFFLRKYKNRKFISGRIYCITPTGLFEPGMFYDILRHVKNNYPGIDIVIDDKIKAVVKPVLTDCVAYTDLKLSLRDYQLEIVNQAISFGRGIIKLGTGGGKTLTIASLISSVYVQNKGKLKCLLIVPDLTLVDQTFNDFINYEVPFKVTRWTGSIDPDLTSNVIVANMGVLQSRFDDNPWIEDVDLLVVDECHKLKKGNKICDIIKAVKTFNKFGLTGTLPDNKPDEWNIVGKLGMVVYDKNSYELRLEKYLTNAEIKILRVNYKDRPPTITVNGRQKHDFRTELSFLYANTFRNNIIKTVANNCKSNVLILVNHIVHGETLYKHLQDTLLDRKVYFIRGEVEVEERARVIAEMEQNNNVVCVAISAIFSTGVNVKNLHMIVFASGGKSFIRVIQSIGRGLRLNPNKEKLTIVDIADMTQYSAEHAKRRQEIYTEEKIQYKIGDIVENQHK